MMVRIGKFLLASAAASALIAGPAWAQDQVEGAQQATVGGDADNTSEATDENDALIVVTANKRAERAIDVPMAITAVSGDDLNRDQLRDIQDLATRVPGLSFTRGGGFGPGTRLIIRGLNTGGSGATVATALDDIPFSISSGTTVGADFATDLDPWDMDRVEVLKGPQGTLYGANAQGGIIKYVTKAPNPDRLEYGFDVGLLNIKDGGIGGGGKGYLNIPLSSVAAFRVTGFYQTEPGWINNELGGDKDLNEVERYGGRISFLVNPTDALSLRATAYLQDMKGDSFDTIEVLGYLDLDNRFEPRRDSNGHYNFNTFVDQPFSVKSRVYSLHANYDFGNVGLQSITSYGTLNTSYEFDNPVYGQVSPVLGVSLGELFGLGPNVTLVSGSFGKLKKFNQEFRLASDNGAAAAGHGLEWQIGAFYTEEKTGFQNNYLTVSTITGEPVITDLSVIVTPPGTPQVFLALLEAKYREIAGYVDATYHFSPQFDVEAGVRVFNNKQSFTQTAGGAIFFPPAFTTTGPFRSEETDFTFAVAPRYHFTPDTMIYARVASGYRPGGPNPVIPPPGPGEPPTPPGSYDSDSTVNYEVGFKGLLLDRKLTVDVTAFYIDWTDIQASVSIRRAFTGYSATVNAGKATSKGIEWNFNFRPVEGLDLNLLGSYTDAQLGTDVPEINGSDGDRLPFVPKWQHTAIANYEFPVSADAQAFVGVNWSYIGERVTGFSIDPTRPTQLLPSYDTWGAQAGLRYRGFELLVYGKNLSNTRGFTSFGLGTDLSNVFGIPVADVPGSAGIIRPREIGIRLRGNF